MVVSPRPRFLAHHVYQPTASSIYRASDTRDRNGPRRTASTRLRKSKQHQRISDQAAVNNARTLRWANSDHMRRGIRPRSATQPRPSRLQPRGLQLTSLPLRLPSSLLNVRHLPPPDIAPVHMPQKSPSWTPAPMYMTLTLAPNMSIITQPRPQTVTLIGGRCPEGKRPVMLSHNRLRNGMKSFHSEDLPCTQKLQPALSSD